MLFIGYSLTLNPYTNEDEYEAKYFALEGSDRTEKFHELRKTYLTGKYELENYGLTLIIAGAYILILMFRGWNSFKIPDSKITITIIGLGAVLITVIGYVGDLCLEMYRGTYPHWADSLGIPLAVTPMLFAIFFVWYLLNLPGLITPFKTGGLVKEIKMKSINYWYLVIIILTIIITGFMIYEGDFWWTTAGLLWTYFYLSLLVGRRDAIIEKAEANDRSV